MATYTQVYTERSAQTVKQELILAHLPLVRHVLARLRARLPSGVDLENLEAAGVLGLVEAANRFDPQRGIRFETFAYPRIRGAVIDELRRNCPLPQNLLERLARVQHTYQRLDPPVTAERLAAETGLSLEDVVECLAAIRLTRAVSWEDFAGPVEPAAVAEQPDRSAEDDEQKKALSQAIASLPERERLAVTLYYLENLRLKEIGLVLELSESRVSRLLKSALFNLGEFLRACEVA